MSLLSKLRSVPKEYFYNISDNISYWHVDSKFFTTKELEDLKYGVLDNAPDEEGNWDSAVLYYTGNVCGRNALYRWQGVDAATLYLNTLKEYEKETYDQIPF